MKVTITQILIFCMTFGWFSLQGEDVLRFQNGDKLTGRYIAHDDGEIVFETAFLGEIRVPEGVVTLQLRQPDAESIVMEEAEGRDAEDDESLTAERIDLAPKEPRFPEWTEFWDDNAVFTWLARIYPLMSWNNRIELGLNLNYAQSDTRSYLARFRTQREIGKTSYLFESSYERAQNTDSLGVVTRTRDRLQGRSRIRRTLSADNHFFAESSTRYNRDLVSRIYHDVEQTGGVGYRWLDTARWQGSVVGSLGAGYREINTTPAHFGFVATAFQDLQYRLSERITISEETNLSYVPTSSDESAYLLRFRAQLESRLNTQLSLNLRYEYYYDERVTNREARTTQSVNVSIGAEF